MCARSLNIDEPMPRDDDVETVRNSNVFLIEITPDEHFITVSSRSSL